MGKISRRTILAGTVALAGVGLISRRAHAADFNLKYGNDLPATHPINKRAAEACDAIRAATNGRLEIQIFPNSQLGGSTDMLSQVRSGALDIFTVGSPLANVIPVSAIPSIAFAFPNFDSVWAAVDGDLGAHIRRQVATKRNWEQLPADLRATALRLMNEGAVKQREDMAKLNATLETQLKEKGLSFNTVNKKPFQEVLKTAGFYAEWRGKFGEDAWKVLERYSGALS